MSKKNKEAKEQKMKAAPRQRTWNRKVRPNSRKRRRHGVYSGSMPEAGFVGFPA